LDSIRFTLFENVYVKLTGNKITCNVLPIYKHCVNPYIRLMSSYYIHC